MPTLRRVESRGLDGVVGCVLLWLCVGCGLFGLWDFYLKKKMGGGGGGGVESVLRLVCWLLSCGNRRRLLVQNLIVRFTG